MWLAIKQRISLQNGLRLLVGASLLGEAIYASMPLFGLLGIILLAQILTNKKCAAPGCEIEK
jgi:hypothetical protein